MKFWIIPILILLIITPFVLKADMTKKILFSNKEYAKQIEVKTYILTQQQVVELFNEPNKEPISFSINELNKLNTKYLVVRLKNRGSRHVWGLLNCQVPNIGFPIKVSIVNINEYYSDFVICLSSTALYQENNNLAPIINYKWDELYTK